MVLQKTIAVMKGLQGKMLSSFEAACLHAVIALGETVPSLAVVALCAAETVESEGSLVVNLTERQLSS